MDMPTRVRLLRILWFFVGCAAMPGDAQAQAAPFPSLLTRVLKGETVIVVDRQGQETRGDVTSVSATSLSLLSGDVERLIPLDAVGLVEKRGDPVWNGAAIAVLFATPSWATAAAFACDDAAG